MFFIFAADWFALDAIGVTDLDSPWIAVTLTPLVLIYVAERLGKFRWFCRHDLAELTRDDRLDRVSMGLRKTSVGDWNSNVYHLDGLVDRVKQMVPEFEEVRAERLKVRAAQKRAETPKGLRSQP